MTAGKVYSLETFGLVDGPGVRFVIFLQGCRMRCQYCHNPDTWKLSGGTAWEARELFCRAWQYRSYWRNNGGITVSGGEPLLQMEFVTELFRLAREKGVHTALDTAGQPFSREESFPEPFRRLLEVTDLVLLDLKAMDSGLHRQLTGWDNAPILDLARYLSDQGMPLWIRHVLVPGLTDSREELEQLEAFVGELPTVERVEILPYHTLGVGKWAELGIPYPLAGVRPPTEEEAEAAQRYLSAAVRALPKAE